MDINSAVGRKAGVNDAKLLAVAGSDLSALSNSERLVVELADAMVTAPANVSDDLYERLRTTFSEEQLLELSAQIALENFRARMNRVFDMKSDGLYEPETKASNREATSEM